MGQVRTLQVGIGAGTAIACRMAGAGRPLLFLHGWGAHGGFFQPQLDALAGRFRVIAPDLRGHGQSAPGTEPAGIALLARDLADLAEMLELEQAVFIGWSLGAMVLWQALLEGRLRQRAAAWVSIDMSPRVLNGPDWRLGLRSGQTRAHTPATLQLMQSDWAGFSPRIARRLFADGMAAERSALIAWATAAFQANDPALMATLWASLTAQDLRAGLGGLDLPGLILHGERSRLYSAATAQWLEQTIPGSRRLGFAGSGHAPHLEEPLALNQALTEFVAGLTPGPASVAAPPPSVPHAAAAPRIISTKRETP